MARTLGRDEDDSTDCGFIALVELVGLTQHLDADLVAPRDHGERLPFLDLVRDPGEAPGDSQRVAGLIGRGGRADQFWVQFAKVLHRGPGGIGDLPDFGGLADVQDLSIVRFLGRRREAVAVRVAGDDGHGHELWNEAPGFLGQTKLPEIAGLLPVDRPLDRGFAGVVRRQGERPRLEADIQRFEMLGCGTRGLLRVAAFVQRRGGAHTIHARGRWDELPDARGLGTRGCAWVHVTFDKGEIDELLGQFVFSEDCTHQAGIAPRPPKGLRDVVRTVCLEVPERSFDAAVEDDRKFGHFGAGRGRRRRPCGARDIVYGVDSLWLNGGHYVSGIGSDGRRRCRRTEGGLRRGRSGGTGLDRALRGTVRHTGVGAARSECGQEEDPGRKSEKWGVAQKGDVHMRAQSEVRP